MQKKYQLALWELRKLQFFNQANKLEKYIVDKIFASDNLVEIRFLGMGFNNTLKTFFTDSLMQGILVLPPASITF